MAQAYTGKVISKVGHVRRRKSLSQEDVASRLRVSRQTMSNIETGRTLPNLAMVFALADVLGVPWSTLYDYGGDE